MAMELLLLAPLLPHEMTEGPGRCHFGSTEVAVATSHHHYHRGMGTGHCTENPHFGSLVGGGRRGEREREREREREPELGLAICTFVTRQVHMFSFTIQIENFNTHTCILVGWTHPNLACMLANQFGMQCPRALCW